MARFFAVGMRGLFSKILKLSIQHQNVTEMIQLNGQFVPINPSEFRNQFTAHIKVGLGTGSKDQQAQRIMGLMQVMQAGIPMQIVGPENVAEAIKLYAEANEFKNPERFVHPQPTGMPDPQQFQQLKQQAMQHIQQLTEQNAQLTQQNQQLQLQVRDKSQELQIRAQEAQLKAQQKPEAPEPFDHANWTKLHIDAAKADSAIQIAEYNAVTARMAQQATERFEGVEQAQTDAQIALDADQQVFGQHHDVARYALDQQAQEAAQQQAAQQPQGGAA